MKRWIGAGETRDVLFFSPFFLSYFASSMLRLTRLNALLDAHPKLIDKRGRREGVTTPLHQAVFTHSERGVKQLTSAAQVLIIRPTTHDRIVQNNDGSEVPTVARLMMLCRRSSRRTTT